MPFRERFVQPVDATVGVAVELGCGARERFEGGRERAQRPLVGRELDDPVEPELALHVFHWLARLVGGQPVDARPEEGIAQILERGRHEKDPNPG